MVEPGGLGLQLALNPRDGQFQYSETPGQMGTDTLLVQPDLLLGSDRGGINLIKKI